MTKPYHVYIAKCSDDSLYTGIATNVHQRIQTHNKKQGAKYTRSRTPVQLATHTSPMTKSQAAKLELLIKKQPKISKITKLLQIQSDICRQCAACCHLTHPYLDVELLPNDDIPPHMTEIRPGGVTGKTTRWMKRKNDNSCIALESYSNSYLCSIYDKRPTECRNFNSTHPLCQKIQTYHQSNKDRNKPST